MTLKYIHFKIDDLSKTIILFKRVKFILCIFKKTKDIEHALTLKNNKLTNKK